MWVVACVHWLQGDLFPAEAHTHLWSLPSEAAAPASALAASTHTSTAARASRTVSCLRFRLICPCFTSTSAPFSCPKSSARPL